MNLPISYKTYYTVVLGVGKNDPTYPYAGQTPVTIDVDASSKSKIVLGLYGGGVSWIDHYITIGY